MKKSTPRRPVVSVTLHFKHPYTGEPLTGSGSTRTFDATSFAGPYGWRGYSHNRFDITAKTSDGKTLRPKAVELRDGLLFA